MKVGWAQRQEGEQIVYFNNRLFTSTTAHIQWVLLAQIYITFLMDLLPTAPLLFVKIPNSTNLIQTWSATCLLIDYFREMCQILRITESSW